MTAAQLLIRLVLSSEEEIELSGSLLCYFHVPPVTFNILPPSYWPDGNGSAAIPREEPQPGQPFLMPLDIIICPADDIGEESQTAASCKSFGPSDIHRASLVFGGVVTAVNCLDSISGANLPSAVALCHMLRRLEEREVATSQAWLSTFQHQMSSSSSKML